MKRNQCLYVTKRLEPHLNWTFGAPQIVHKDVKCCGSRQATIDSFSQIICWFPGLNPICASHCVSLHSAVLCVYMLSDNYYQQEPQISFSQFALLTWIQVDQTCWKIPLAWLLNLHNDFQDTHGFISTRLSDCKKVCVIRIVLKLHSLLIWHLGGHFYNIIIAKIYFVLYHYCYSIYTIWLHLKHPDPQTRNMLTSNFVV